MVYAALSGEVSPDIISTGIGPKFRKDAFIVA